MDDKKIMALIAVCLTAVFCFALYLAAGLGDESDMDTIVVIDEPAAVSETAASETVQPGETHSAPIQTDQVHSAAAQPVTERLWLNLNTAASEELQKLDGIGPETAGNIIEYRTVNRGFRNVEELLEVSGIGEKKLENIRSYIYVENPEYYSPQEDTEIISEETAEPEPENEHEPQPEEIAHTETENEPAPEKIPAPEPETVTELTLEIAAPININTAAAEELMLLPHVTEEIAERIITLREELGGYTHEYQLLYIEELEQKQVAEMIEFVTVGQ